MEYYLYNVPVFVMGEAPPYVSVSEFCTAAEEVIPAALLANVDVVYIGNLRELSGRNAAYNNGAIYMTNSEPTSEDMLENFVHEVAHSLESAFGTQIYTHT